MSFELGLIGLLGHRFHTFLIFEGKTGSLDQPILFRRRMVLVGQNLKCLGCIFALF